MQRCSVFGNHAGAGSEPEMGGNGGGIYSVAGYLRLIDCDIYDNEAGAAGLGAGGGNGGGLYICRSIFGVEQAPDDIVVLSDCRITGNRASDAGNTYPFAADATGGSGGGVYVVDSPCRLIGCRISGNTAGNGGDVDPSVVPTSDVHLGVEATGGDGGDGGGLCIVRSSSSISVRLPSLLQACSLTDNETGRGGDGNGLTNCTGGRGGDGGGIAVVTLGTSGILEAGLFEASTIAHNRTGRGGHASRSEIFGLGLAVLAGDGGDGGGLCFDLAVAGNPPDLQLMTIAENATGSAGNGGAMISAGSGGSGGGLCGKGVVFQFVQLAYCLLVNNSAAGQGPDSAGGYSATADNMVTVPDVDQIGIGSVVQVADPRLAPLGHYPLPGSGGATLSMPPLPGSPALDYGPAVLRFEQRLPEFPFVADGDGDGTAALDLGAVELLPPDDFATFWPLDWDGDGNSYGLEQAVGTDPLVADSGDPRVFGIVGPVVGDGPVTLRFGIDPDADPRTLWIVYRSTGLNPGSWVEVYRFVGATGTGTAQPGFSASFGSPPLDPDTLFLTDEAPPSPRAFYRLEVNLDGSS